MAVFCLNQEGRKLLSGPGSDRRRRNTMTMWNGSLKKVGHLQKSRKGSDLRPTLGYTG